MRAGFLDVIDGGLANSIQDQGRVGFRHMGIAVSGYLDAPLAQCANALVGNTTDCACIEIRAAGPVLKAEGGPIRVALAGDISATLQRANGATLDIGAWQSVTLQAQESLAVGYIAGGVAYLAVEGGILSPRQLGSRSTYQRAEIGGIDGRTLMSGDHIACALSLTNPYEQYAAPPWCAAKETTPIRVMLGPQHALFTAEAIDTLLRQCYRVSAELDRMGMRLEGPPLKHLDATSKDIVSDGVALGAMQVPGNGQPIILLADCQTVGGYPKIATVISADLPRLAQMQAGQSLRFAAVDFAAARQALRQAQEEWQRWANACVRGLPNAAQVSCDGASVWDENVCSKV